MHYPDYPPTCEEWNQRRAWFNEELDRAMGEGGYLVSEQACALSIELERAYCAGAWAGVVVLAVAVLDAQLREAELPGYDGNTKNLIALAGANPRLQKLRQIRNTYVHVDRDQPALTVDRMLTDGERMRTDAEEAIQLVFEALFMSPWV